MKCDGQRYLYSKSKRPACLKKSIPFSQALRLKGICSTATACDDESAKLTQRFVEQGYKADILKEKIEQASNIPREILLSETKNNNNVSRIPLTISYNRSTPNVSQTMKKLFLFRRLTKS